MEQTETSQTLRLQAPAWGRLATTSVAHLTEHLYVGINTVVLPVMATALGMSMAQAGFLISARSLVAGLLNISLIVSPGASALFARSLHNLDTLCPNGI